MLLQLQGTTATTNSEGVHIEYIAIFLALVFPGALVAFDYELLESLPHFSALRIYCAGIWNNATFCAACGLSLFLLPLILSPLYVHSENPMVLYVAPSSPLSGYLTHGDMIVSLDGSPVHDPQDWMTKMSLLDGQTLKESNYSGTFQSHMAAKGMKGYCVPRSWVEDGMHVEPVDGLFACPDELMAFKDEPCFNFSLLNDDTNNSTHKKKMGSSWCLPAKAVVKLKKCGDGWRTTGMNQSTCPCSQDGTCLMPVQMPGLTWVEITFSRPYSSECLQQGGNSSLKLENPDFISTDCGGTFVYVGDVLSEAHSIQLTAYRPRWAFSLSTYLPNILEKMLAYTFHVSATLALLNSLPVFMLDGESILEVCLCYITCLSTRKRKRVLQTCLLGGSFLSILAFSWILISIVLGHH